MQIEKEVLRDLLYGLLAAVNAAPDGAVIRAPTLPGVLLELAYLHPEKAVGAWLISEIIKLGRVS
jgi:hypothetical protein